MAVQWGLGQQQGPDVATRFLMGFQQGQQQREQAEVAGLRREAIQQQRQTRDTGTVAGKHIAAGDYPEAGRVAAASGDMDLMRTVQGLSQEQRAQLAQQQALLAPLRYRLRQIPDVAQRRAMIQAARPRLVAAGVRPDLIDGYDPSDAQLDTDIAQDMTLQQAIAQDSINWEGVAGGEMFATDSQGRPLAQGDPRLRRNAPPAQPASPAAGQPAPEAPAPAAPQAPAATPTGANAGGFDAFYSGFLAPAEGGYVASDGRSGAPANFGINQRANPDIDVRSLTQEQARQLMYERYWVPSGADQIQDPALQAVHADTAVNMGVSAAHAMLERSGGDPQRYLQLREQRYREIGGSDLPGWLARNDRLAQFIGGTQLAQASAQPPQSIQDQAMTGRIPRPPPPGYRYDGQGNLQAIPGGPGDQSYQRGNEGRNQRRQDRGERRQDRAAITQLVNQFEGNPIVQRFNIIRTATMQIQQLASAIPQGAPGRAQADLALIFSFMRVLDPTSVVRESEQATARNAAGIPERIRTQYNRALAGESLSPEQRDGMVRAASGVYIEQARTYNEVAERYRPLFRDAGAPNPGELAPLARAPATDERRRQRSQQAPRGRTQGGIRWRRVG